MSKYNDGAKIYHASDKGEGITEDRNDKPTGTVFDVMGHTVEISAEELQNALVEQVLRQGSRQADVLEEINHTLEHIVKLLKPWAEREKRRNMLEQDPDYLEQVIKQVQADRRARKPKGKKRK